MSSTHNVRSNAFDSQDSVVSHIQPIKVNIQLLI